MSTIASQIKRIQDATNSLRDTGTNLRLYTVDVADSLRIDDIADAFAGITLQTGKHDDPVEIPILIKNTTDGHTIVELTNTLPAGYYSNPINLVATLEDDTATPYVLNIQTKQLTVATVDGNGTTAAPYRVTISPDSGFNYMNHVDVQLQAATFTTPSAEATSFNRAIAYEPNAPVAEVTFALNKKGWINNDYKAVLHVSKPSWKRNSQSVTDAIDTASQLVKVHPSYRTVLNLDKGLLPNGLQLTIPSLKDITNVQTDNAATPADVIDGKQFYVNGQLYTGILPDYRTSGSTVKNYYEADNKTLSFNVLHGAYSANSVITTDIAYNPPLMTLNYNVPNQDKTNLQLYNKSGNITIRSGYYDTDIVLTTTVIDSTFGSGKWNNHTVSFTCTGAGWVAKDTKLEYNIQHSTLNYALKHTTSTTDTDDLDVTKDGYWEFTPDSGTYYSKVQISPRKIIELLESI
jgi:hypothetical protein